MKVTRQEYTFCSLLVIMSSLWMLIMFLLFGIYSQKVRDTLFLLLLYRIAVKHSVILKKHFF